MKRRVIIVEDQVSYRGVLKGLLNKIDLETEIVAEVSTGEQFLKVIKKENADIVFMDLRLPGMTGIEATKLALKINPNLVIVGLSLFSKEPYIKELINAGARGYLLKMNNNIDIITEIIKNPRAKLFFSNGINLGNKSKTSSTKTVVVVDDFQTNVLATGAAMKIAGYKVLNANSGIEALNYFNGNDISLLITDFKMPGMTGADLIKKIRTMRQYKNMPAIVVSSEKGDKEKQLAREAGISAWFKKPYDLNKFMKIIKKILGDG